MIKRRALHAVVAATVTIALAYLSAFVPGAGTAGAWLMAMGLATMVVALMVLGAVRPGGGLHGLRWPLVVTFLAIAGCFSAALLLPGETATTRVILGLPLRAAIVVYGVGLIPLLVLPMAYARTFDAMTLSEDDIARVRALARPVVPGESSDGAGGP